METGFGVNYHVKRLQGKKQEMEANLVLLYVLKGHANVHMDGHTVNMKRGDILLVNPGITFETGSSEETLLGKCSWSIAVLKQILHNRQAYFYCNSAAGYSRYHVELRKELDNLTAVYAAGEHETDSLMVGYMFRILDLLIERFKIGSFQPGASRNGENTGKNGRGEYLHCLDEGDVGPTAGESAGSQNAGLRDMQDGALTGSSAQADEYMIRIMQYIMQNLHGELSLTDLAKEMFVSISTLSRVFKKRTGLYFADYVNQLRVKEATALLVDSEESLTQIGLITGFSGSSSFSRAFKKVTGETPGEYRDRIRKEMADNHSAAVREEQSIRNELFASGTTGEDGTVRRLVQVNLSRKNKVPLVKVWNKAVNMGEVYDMTKANVQNHCLYLRDHLQFQYVRLWNVFSKNLMLTNGRSSGKYNFTMLDQVIDFLLENHLKPFLDFGRRASMAMTADWKVIYYEETYTTFSSRRLWEDAFGEVLRHLRRKYGREEVSTWIFELSRDSVHGPEGERCYKGEDFDFFEAWRYAYKTVRREAPGSLFGGVSASADIDETFLADFYRKCSAGGFTPDFCSFGFFPYTDIYSPDGQILSRKNPGADAVQLYMDKVRRIMDGAGIGSCPIYFTDWNNTLANRNYLNDSCFRASFFVRELLRIQMAHQVELVCPLAGTDWISYYLDSNTIVHGGIGLLTKNAIRKPAYFAISFLNRLGSDVVDAAEDYILTRSESGSYFLLCTHFVPFEYPNICVQASEAPDLSILHMDQYPAHVLAFRLSGMKEKGYYCIKSRIISASSGSILDEWANFQFSDELTADDIRYLKERCIPEIRMRREYVGEVEELSFEVEMRPEDVVLVHIYLEER